MKSTLLSHKSFCRGDVKIERTNVPISFWKRNQNGFGIVPEFVLLRTDCFDLVQNLLSWTK
jgi:hypothetical protein